LHLKKRNDCSCKHPRLQTRITLIWKRARQARVSGIAASDRRRSFRGKQNITSHASERYASRDETPASRRGVVHLKGPFISTCVYCPSCVWPRISLLRFVSPLQRSQYIFPRAQAGSHLTFWRSAPQRSTRNKRLCPQTHRARARAHPLKQRRDTIPLPLWSHVHVNARERFTYTSTRIGMGAPKRYERARQKRTYSLPKPLERQSREVKENVYLYTDGI